LEFYEVFNTKNNTCIITELCEGGDLSKLLKEKKSVPEADAVNILKQIINGYRGIYKFGIVHRDLKPANIFFVNGKVKIADFGFAVKEENIKK
jgi:serine/threonine protein kinase